MGQERARALNKDGIVRNPRKNAVDGEADVAFLRRSNRPLVSPGL